MKLRKATVDDIDAMIELRKQQLVDEGGSPLRNIDRELRDYFFSELESNTFISWLALENDTIIATSGLCFYRLPPSYANPSGMVAYITNMFTVKEHRRKGIASILLEKVLKEAQALGFPCIIE